MTPEEFYQRLCNKDLPESGVITLSPGPIALRIGKQDYMAARMLLWLQNEMPDGATMGDLFDALDAARYWATFWASLEDAPGKQASP